MHSFHELVQDNPDLNSHVRFLLHFAQQAMDDCQREPNPEHIRIQDMAFLMLLELVQPMQLKGREQFTAADVLDPHMVSGTESFIRVQRTA